VSLLSIYKTWKNVVDTITSSVGSECWTWTVTRASFYSIHTHGCTGHSRHLTTLSLYVCLSVSMSLCLCLCVLNVLADSAISCLLISLNAVLRWPRVTCQLWTTIEASVCVWSLLHCSNWLNDTASRVNTLLTRWHAGWTQSAAVVSFVYFWRCVQIFWCSCSLAVSDWLVAARCVIRSLSDSVCLCVCVCVSWVTWAALSHDNTLTTLSISAVTAVLRSPEAEKQHVKEWWQWCSSNCFFLFYGCMTRVNTMWM